MKIRNVYKLLISAMSLVVLSAPTAVHAKEFLFACNSTNVVQIDADGLGLLSQPITGKSGITDITVSSEGIYSTDSVSGQIRRYSFSGTWLNSSYNGAWNSICISPNGKNVIAHNTGTALAQFSSTLTYPPSDGPHVLWVGNGSSDISAGPMGIYSIIGDGRILRYPLGSGVNDLISVGLSLRVVKVGADGYVYARTDNSTIKMSPSDFGVYSVIHASTGVTALLDFDDVPFGSFTDIAISHNNKYFYAADGTYIWKFNIEGGRAIARSDAGGYTKIDMLFEEDGTVISIS